MTERLSDLDAWFDEQENQGQGTLATVDPLADLRDPDEIAQERRVAEEAGQPSAAVRAYPELFAQRAEANQRKRETQDTPRFAQWLDEPGNLDIARDDIATLSQMERLGDREAAVVRWRDESRDYFTERPWLRPFRGLISIPSGLARPVARAIDGSDETLQYYRAGQDEQELLQLERRQQRAREGLGDPLNDQEADELANLREMEAPEGGIPVVREGLRQIPLLQGMADRVITEFRDPTTAAGLIYATPQGQEALRAGRADPRLLAEGRVAEYGFDAGADAARQLYWSIGSLPGSGAITYIWDMEAAGVYRAAIEQGVPHEIAVDAAEQAGALNAAVEVWGAGLILGRSGIDEIAEGAVTRDAIRNVTMRQALSRAGIRGAEAGFIGGAEEGVQETISITAEAGARRRAGVAAPEDLGLAERYAESLLAGMEGGGALGGPVVSANLYFDMRAVRRAEANQQAFNDLVQSANASRLRERLPSAAANAIDASVAGTPIETIRIAADGFVEHFQGQRIDPGAAAEQVGVSRAELAQALASGGDIQVRTGAFYAHMAATQQQLLRHARWDARDFTQAEIEGGAQERIETQVREMVEEAAKKTDEGGEIGAFVEQRMRTLFEQAEQEGGYRPEVSRRYAQMAAALPRAMVARARAIDPVYADKLEGQFRQLFGERFDIAGPGRDGGFEGATQLDQRPNGPDAGPTRSDRYDPPEGVRMSEKMRKIVEMAVNGASNDWIAEEMGIEPGNVRVTLTQAKGKLGGQAPWEAGVSSVPAGRNARTGDLTYTTEELVAMYDKLARAGYTNNEGPGGDNINTIIARTTGMNVKTVASRLSKHRAAVLEAERAAIREPEPESAAEMRRAWVETQTVRNVVPGGEPGDYHYGFALSNGRQFYVGIADDGNGAANIDWSFLERLKNIDPDDPTSLYGDGDETIKPSERKEIRIAIRAIFEADMAAHERPAYVFTPQRESNRRTNANMIAEMGDDLGYNLLEDQGAVYLIRPDANIAKNGRIQPQPGWEPNFEEPQDYGSQEDADAAQAAFYASVEAAEVSADGPSLSEIARATRQERKQAEESRAKAEKDARGNERGAGGELNQSGRKDGIGPDGLPIRAREPGRQSFVGGSGDLAEAARMGYRGQDTGEALEWTRAVAKGLPMDEASRMERAREMGFDTDTVLYHSTLTDLRAFNSNGQFYGNSGLSGIHLTDNAEMASRYLDRYGDFDYKQRPFTKNIMPVFIRPGNVRRIEGRVYDGPQAVQGFPVAEGYKWPRSLDGVDTVVRPDSISSTGDVQHASAEDLAILRELADDPTYHGEPISGTEYIVRDPANIRSRFAAFDPDFSESANLLAQGEGPQLAALHNLTPENLIRAAELGGLAVPSVGVVTEGQGLQDIGGSITLIGRRDLADPANEPVYDADVWSPTFPRAEYNKVPSKKVSASPLYQAFNRWDEVYGQRFRGAANGLWDNTVNAGKPDDAIHQSGREAGAMAAYLESVGEAPAAPIIRDIRPGQLTPWAHQQAWLDFVRDNPDMPYFRDATSEETEAYSERASAAALAAIKQMAESDTRNNDLPQDERRILADHLIEVLTERSFSDGRLTLSYLDRAFESAKSAGKTEIDNYASRDALEAQIGDRAAEYRTWLEREIRALYGEPFLKLGRKKVPFTLDNVVEAMTGRVQAQQDHLTFGDGKARAAGAKRFRDLEEMRRAAARQIRSPAEAEAAQEETKKLAEQWRNSLTRYYRYVREASGRNEFGATWESFDAAMRALSKVMRGAKTEANMARALRAEEFIDVPPHILAEGVDLAKAFLATPVPYFEAKPQRAVRLNEFVGAVIPQSAPQQVRDILTEAGVPFREYDNADRASQASAAAAYVQELGALFQTNARGSIRYENFRSGEFGSAMIRMGKSSDLSTFLHEFGHLGHLVLESIATDEAAPAEFKAMWDNTLQWWGLNQEQWTALTNEQKTPYFEQWARTFEAYLMEGKAPSLTLREAFAAFKAWLTQIYRSVLRLDANLNPQIRDVFDRMLATDAEMAEARAAMGADFALPLDMFTEAERALIVEARDAQDAELRARVMDRFVRKEKRWWRSERERVRTTAEIEVDSDPARRALEWLAFNEWRALPVEQNEEGVELPQDASLQMPEGLPEMRLDMSSLDEADRAGLPVELRPLANEADADAALENAMALKRQGRARQPQRLWSFIKAAGGIKDEGGEITQALGSARSRPGLINNTSGLSADELALRAWEAGYFGAPPRQGVLNQFGGWRAATANMDTLQLAKDLERAGNDRGYIWQHSGWARGLDGEWRFEIPSEDLRVIRPLNQVARRKTAITVGEVIDWPSLFAAYPHLENLEIEFTSDKTEGGSYWHRDGGNAIIFITRGHNSAALLSVLRHELQHAIQRFEGFAEGYNPDSVTRGSARWKKAVQVRLSHSEQWRKHKRGTAEPTADDIREAEAGAAFAVYANEMGEIEARDVQNRARSQWSGRRGDYSSWPMSPEERAAVPPNDVFDIYRDPDLTWRAPRSRADSAVPRQTLLQGEAPDAGVWDTETFYHGSARPIEQFDGPIHLTPDESIASLYSNPEFRDVKGGGVIPLQIRRGRTLVIDEPLPAGSQRALIERARREGYDTIEMRAVRDDIDVDGNVAPQRQIIVLDARNNVRRAGAAPDGGASGAGRIPSRLTVEIQQPPGQSGSRYRLELDSQKNGFITVTDDGDVWFVNNSHIDPDLRGQGHGVRLYEDLVLRAREAGARTLRSDHSVSGDAQNAWMGLQRRGYPVRRIDGPDGPQFEVDLTSFGRAPDAPNAGPAEGSFELFQSEQIRRRVIDTDRGPVIINPNRSDMQRMTRVPLGQRDKAWMYDSVRYIIDRDGNVFVGPGANMIHDEIAAAAEGAGFKVDGYQYGDSYGHGGGIETGSFRRVGDVFVFDDLRNPSRMGNPVELFQGGDETGGRRPTPREFIDALIDDIKNIRQVYSSKDEEAVAAYQNRSDAIRWFEARGIDLSGSKEEIRAQITEALQREQEEAGGGWHPDDIAPWFGFSSGDELVQALKALKPRAVAIEESIEARLEGQYGDPLKDGTVAEAAALAGHIEAQSKRIEIELAAIQRATGGRATPVGKAARAYAERQVTHMTVKQIRGFETFLAGERRAARNAMEATQKKKFDEAALWKQRQLISFHLYRLARDAAEEMDRAQRYFQKFDRDTIRAKIHAPLLDQIDQALEGIDLRAKPRISNRKRQSFLNWYNEMVAEGLTHQVAVDPDFLAEVQNKPFTALTLEEARGIRDAVRNFEHIGRRWREVLGERDARLLDEAVSEMAASMAEVKPFEIANPADHSAGIVESIDRKRQAAHAHLSRVEPVARAMDRNKDNGPVWNGLFRPLTEARDREEVRQQQAQADIEQLFSVYTAEERADMWVKRKYYPQVPNRDGSRMGRNFTKQEILAIALNTGNDYNLAALLEGESRNSGMTETQLRALLDAAMTKRDWEFVQAAWDYVDSFWPEIEALYVKSAGVAPAKVQAAPFRNRHGEWRGGYWHLEYDFGRDQRVRDEMENGAVQQAFGGFRARTQTPNGFAKARQGSGGRPVRLDLSILTEHVNEVIHDLEFRMPVLNVWRLVKHDGFRAAFVRAAGQEMYDTLKPWLQYTATERMPPERMFAGVIKTLRRNTPIALMGYAVGTIAQQPAGIMATFHRVGTARVMGKLVELSAQPWRWMEHARFINARSKFMSNYATISQRELREMVAEANSKAHLDAIRLLTTGTASQKAQALGYINRSMQRFAMFPLAFVNKWVASVAWQAAYDKALAGHVEGVSADNEADVVAYADQMIRTTFGSGRPEDLPPVMRSSEIEKMITPAFSYFSTQYNAMFNEQAPGMMRGQISPLEFTTFILWTLIIQALVSQWLAGRWEPDDDESEEERNLRLAMEVATVPAAGIPLVRDMTRGITRVATTGEAYGFNSVPALGALTATGTGIGGAVNDLAEDGEISRRTARDLTMASGYWFGLPSRQMWTTGSYLSDVASGDEDLPWDAEDPVDATSEALLRDTR